jgi:RNA polymerase sigma-70 factor (ECF subfamily)
MDKISFKDLFLPLHSKLYGIAYRLLENKNDAEDLIQEAYIKLWDKRRDLRGIRNAEAYSVALVKNLCFDLLRSGKYHLNRQSADLKEADGETEADALELRDEANQVKQLIAKLPQMQQKIIVMRDIKECTYDEIEAITGITQANIRVLLSRARKKVREQFEKLNRHENKRN